MQQPLFVFAEIRFPEKPNRPYFAPFFNRFTLRCGKTGGDADETPVDGSFMGTLGGAGFVRRRSTAAGQCIQPMPGPGLSGAGAVGSGARRVDGVGSAGRTARSAGTGTAAGAGNAL